MSMMLLEALTVAPVVVCSDIPANVDVVGPAYPFLFRSGDADRLRCVLEGVLGGSVPVDHMRSVRREVAERFQWDQITPSYEKLYAQLV